jgi:hypothetical protein
MQTNRAGIPANNIADVSPCVSACTLPVWQMPWRWIFFIDIPVGLLLSLYLTSALISDPPHLTSAKNGGRVRIDFIGLAFLSVGLGFLQLALDKGQRDDWFGSHKRARPGQPGVRLHSLHRDVRSRQRVFGVRGAS